MISSNTKRYIIAALLIIGSIQCSTSFYNLTSQLNEQRVINLNDHLGLVYDNFKVTSNSSSYLLSQPVEYLQSSSFSSYGQIISFDEVGTSNGEVYQVQLSSDEILSQTSRNCFLSIISIKRGLIEEIAKLQFNLTQNIQYKEVVFIQKDKGILLSSDQQTSFLQLFYLDQNNNINLSLNTNLNSLEYNIFISPFIINNNISILSYSDIKNTIYLREITSAGLVSGVLSQELVCNKQSEKEDFEIHLIPNKSSYIIKCQNRKNKYYLFEQYKITNKNRNLSLLSSSTIQDNQQRKIIKASRAISNQNYILELIPSIENQLILTQLSKVEVKSLDIQANSLNFIGFFISSDNLITLISQQEVLGISIQSSNNIFRVPLKQYDGFEPVFSQRYGDQIELQYQSIRTNPWQFQSRLFKTNIPQIVIQQKYQTQQYYVSSLNNSKNLIITSNLNTSNTDQVQISQQDIMAYQVINSSTCSFDKEIESNFIGSHLQFNVSKFTPTSLYALDGSIRTINPVQSKLGDSIQIDKIVDIYPAYQNHLLIETFDSVSLINIEQNNGEYQLNPLITIKLEYFIQQVDSNGFFTYQNSENYSAINLFMKSNENSYKFEQIITDCEKYSEFKFSSSPRNNFIAISCNTQIKILSYQIELDSSFTYQSHEIKLKNQISSINQIDLRESGNLLIETNSSIISYNIHQNYQIGTVDVPLDESGVPSGKILLFQESFLVVRNENHLQTIKQYSYNNFNGNQAQFLREFDRFNFKWNLLSSQSIKRIKNNKINSILEEFAVIDAISLNQKYVKLYYRIDKVSSANQLYQSIEINPQTFFFSLSSFAGSFNKKTKQLQLYTINYFAKINIHFNSKELFENTITNKHLALITINKNYSFNFYLNIQRNLSSTQNSNNESQSQIQKFITDFSKNKSLSHKTYILNDSQFKNNFLGWRYESMLNNEINKSIKQRLNIKQYKQEYIADLIEVSPGVLMTCSDQQVELQNKIIMQFDKKSNCQLIMEEVTQMDTHIIFMKKIFYSLSIQKEDQLKSKLTKYIIQISKTTETQVKIMSTQIFNMDSPLFYYNNLIKILNDDKLGLLALLRPYGSALSKVCQLRLDENKMKFNFNCELFNTINQLEIIDVMWFQQGQANLFISSSDNIYYGFNYQQSQYQTIELKKFLISKYRLNNERSTIRKSIKLNQSSLMVEYNNNQIFILNFIKQYNQITICEDSYTLYPESGYHFTGNAVLLNNQQALLTFTEADNPLQIIYFLYEPFEEMSSEFIVKSSASITLKEGSLNNIYIKMIVTGKKEIVSLITTMKEEIDQPLILQISEQSILNIQNHIKNEQDKSPNQ